MLMKVGGQRTVQEGKRIKSIGGQDIMSSSLKIKFSIGDRELMSRREHLM